MSEESAGRLAAENERLRAENAKRREKSRTQAGELEKLRADNASAAAKIADLESKVGKPTEQTARIESLTGQLRSIKGKMAFERLAIKAGMKANAVDAAWNALGVKSDTDEPDEDALAAVIDGAKESHDFFFSAPESSPPPVEAKPPVRSLGSDRGKSPNSLPGLSMKRSDYEAKSRDPAWCHSQEYRDVMANQKAGTLTLT